MAAALVLLARWYPEMPFVDPVCGSGTIPIEAALIGCNIAPGLKRNFAFENWDWVDKDIIKQAREQAQAAIKKDIDLDISGYDIDGSMI